MATTSIVLFELELADADEEEQFLLWWREATRLLGERFRLTSADLAVLTRGAYLAMLGFPLPGVWKLVEQDARWRQLEASRPRADVKLVQARHWHLDGNPRDITTTELARRLRERASGARDFLLVDTLPPQSYAAGHIPGAINLPVRAIDATSATRILGGDRERTIVVYCTGYG